MDFIDLLFTTLAKDSPAIITMLIVLVFAVFLVNKLVPIMRVVVDDIAKPMVPFAAQALVVMQAQSASIESHAEITLQLVATVNDGLRTTRELFEQRILSERKETNAQMKEKDSQMKKLEDRIKELEQENTDLKKENNALKDKVTNLEKSLAKKPKTKKP